MTNFGSQTANPLISNIDSCGTGAYHEGDSPDPRTMSVLADHGVTRSSYSHAARKFRNSDFTTFDYIFAMDDDNKDYLDRARNRLIKKGDVDEDSAGKVMLFGVWGGKGEEEVIDPYYGARNGFEVAHEQMVRFSTGFLRMLQGKGEAKQ